MLHRSVSSRLCFVLRGYASSAGSGFTGYVSDIATSRIQANKDKQFLALVESMVSSERWTLRAWRSTLGDQLNSWLMYIPGLSSSNEVQQMKSFKELLDAAPDNVLDSSQAVSGAAKEQIHQCSGKSIDEINRMVIYFNQSLLIQRWLQMK